MLLKRVEQWLDSVGISIETDKVRIRATEGGLGVFAVKAVHEGDPLCTIPKSAVLSVKTSGIANLLEENKIRGGLGLIIAILYEMSLHAASPWWGYLSELPSREYLPMFWTTDELTLLQGTVVAANAMEDLEHTQEDFDTHVLPLVEQHPGLLKAEIFTIGNFRRAASWVASRAFGVDSHHGMSLVPLADIFNHKAAIVWLSDDYAIEPVCFEDVYESGSDDDVAAACGDDDCRAPGCRDHHHGGAPTSRGSLLQGVDSIAARQYQLELGICGAVRDDGVELLQIVAASKVPKGDEVHNTYGELGNVDLVSKYGFALDDNPFSVVVLDKGLVLQAAERMMGMREMRLRCRFLRKESELLDEDSEPFEILPQGCIGPSLFVTLFVICADGQLFSRWGDIEDAIRSIQEAQRAPASCAPPEAGRYAEIGCRNKQDSHQNMRKRRREASTARMTDEHQLGRPGASADQPSTPEQTSSQARDGSISVQEHPKRNEIINDGSQDEVEDGSHDEGEWQPSIITLKSAARSLINDRLAACLRTAVMDHLQLYKHQSLAADLEQLREAQRQCDKLRYRDEHWKAVLAALRLVVQEKRILQEALRALQEQ